MRWRGARRGFFEGPPRAIYRRSGRRYLEACGAGVLLNGVVVSGFGVVALALYVDLTPGEIAVFAACTAAAFALEGALAARYLVRAAAPAGAWLEGERGEEAARAAWSAAALVPTALVRRAGLYAAGAAGAVAGDLVLAALLDLPAREAALLFPL